MKDNEIEYIETEMSIHSAVSIAAFAVTAGIVFLVDYVQLRVFGVSSVVIAAVWGIMASATAYAISRLLAMPAILEFLSIVIAGRPRPEALEKTTRQQATAPAPSGLRTEAAPEWEQRMDGRIVDGFLKIGTQYVPLPDDFDIEHLYQIAKFRWAGLLPTVSERALHEAGISRFEEPPNAATVIEFLQRAGLIERGAANRPAVWTVKGEALFALPHRNENFANGGGGTRLTTATTTAATANTAGQWGR